MIILVILYLASVLFAGITCTWALYSDWSLGTDVRFSDVITLILVTFIPIINTYTCVVVAIQMLETYDGVVIKGKRK
jgi:hypothetical protein